MANVEWLLREAMGERPIETGERMAIDDAQWRASIERLELGPGLRVFLTDVEARQDLAIEARDDRTDQWVGSQVAVAGRADIAFPDGGRTHLPAGQAILFRPGGRYATYALTEGVRFHAAGYAMEVGRIARLFEGEVPAGLRALVEERDESRSRIVDHGASGAMLTAAEALFARGLNGPLRILMMEGAVLQLLALQAAAASGEPHRLRQRALARKEREAVHEARRMLLADMRAPPTLGELAVGVGLSEKRLNAGFRELFGATAFEVLRNERLAHARIALESDDALLKEIAYRVGYNHVSNFINAFKRSHGAPPRQYLAGGTAPVALGLRDGAG